MKVFILIVIISFLALGCSSESAETSNDELIAENEEVIVDSLQFSYDSIYAQEIGADDYGMKAYVMAFLMRGPNRPEDPKIIDSLQSAHMANIGKLAEEGKLVLAGPFFGDDDIRGIYIFDTDSIEEAAAWTATDPAIIYGSLEMDLRKWYGSAALMSVGDLHKKGAKINF